MHGEGVPSLAVPPCRNLSRTVIWKLSEPCPFGFLCRHHCTGMTANRWSRQPGQACPFRLFLASR